MRIRFVVQSGGPLHVEMQECPRLEEFVDLGNGMDYWVRSVRWLPLVEDDPEFQRQADVELAMGHPPRFRK